MELRGRIAEACEEYERDADDIAVVAVSKRHSVQAIKIAVSSGVIEIGESRVQEAETKIRELGHIARYHLVGHLQTNKAKKAVELFDVIQSIDSFKLAEEINRLAQEAERTLEGLIQVNCSGEASKHGVSPDQAADLIRQASKLEGLKITGLMTIGPLTDDEEAIRAAYATCRELYNEGQDIVGDDFDILSMGMSDDFPLAIAEGSNMIRIGTGIFGPRPA